VAHKIAYLDALAAEGYLKIYTDVATGTKSDRPQWNEFLKDLRPGDCGATTSGATLTSTRVSCVVSLS
jgi:DNA invertase Pin-like site-specific DNA recombinase